MKIKEKREEINRIILDGRIPLAFIESVIINNSSSIQHIDKKKLNSKYLQKNLPDAASPLLISKIYEFY